MPLLANPKHERFAQEVAKGRSATAAYEAAGYKRNQQNASRLMLNDVVAARVAELLAGGAQRAETTREWLIARAEEARQAAMNDGRYSAAVAAIKELGILSGVRVEHHEIRRESAFDVLTPADKRRLADLLETSVGEANATDETKH